MEQYFFDGWMPVLRTLILGVLAYIALVVLLRASGKRTLSKMNAFDFVVTVAIGSTLATILLSRNVTLVQGVTAFAVLIFLQYAITWVSVRFEPFNRLIKAEPRMLYYRGEYLADAMKRERVNRDEVLAKVRNAGYASLDEVDAIVMETDGELTVVQKKTSGTATTLENVQR